MLRLANRIIVFFIVIFLVSSNIFSQQNNFLAGVFFNANGIEVKGANEIFWQSSEGTIWGGGGISFGINIKRYAAKNSYLNLELRYIQKGSVYEYYNLYNTTNLDIIRINYIEIPLLWGQEIYIKEKIYIIESGFGFANQFSSKSKIEEFGARTYVPDVQNFKNTDITWVSGFKFPLNRKGKQNLLFGFRFSYSLFSIHKNYNLRNMVYGIQFDYLINK